MSRVLESLVRPMCDAYDHVPKLTACHERSQNEAKYVIGIRQVSTAPSPSSPQSQSPQTAIASQPSAEPNVLANSGTRRSKRLGKSKGQTSFLAKKVLVTGADTVEDIKTNVS